MIGVVRLGVDGALDVGVGGGWDDPAELVGPKVSWLGAVGGLIAAKRMCSVRCSRIEAPDLVLAYRISGIRLAGIVSRRLPGRGNQVAVGQIEVFR